MQYNDDFPKGLGDPDYYGYPGEEEVETPEPQELEDEEAPF